MDRSNQITLVGVTYTTDDIGQRVATETSTIVYCSVESVSRAEWAAASKIGIKPQYTVRMFSPEYSGEQVAELNGKRYGIYRTYQDKDETLELYLEEKAGIYTVTTT